MVDASISAELINLHKIIICQTIQDISHLEISNNQNQETQL